MTTCHAPSCALLHPGKSHLNSYINPAKPRRCTKKIKTKTEKVKIKPEKTKIKPKKIKMQTTSCNMTAPWISCCTSLGVFGEDTSTSANQQYQNDCTPSSACKSSSWWDFFSYSSLTQRSGQTHSSQIRLINHLLTPPRSKRQISVSQAPPDWTNVPLANDPARNSTARVTCL